LNFLWPEMLWTAAALPVLVALYLWLVRRRRDSLEYSNLGLVRQAMQSGRAWRRVVPPGLLLLAGIAMVLAAARPTAPISLPSSRQTIVLVMDVSGSMIAKDVAPDRLMASQIAAQEFVSELPANIRVGVVAYGGSAHLVQTPTLNREHVIRSIQRFQLQPGTAIGSGLVVALATLFPDAGYDVLRLSGKGGKAMSDFLADGPRTFAEPGSETSAAIVLLSDGKNTMGPDPLLAAQLAAERGIRVFTVGFGTPEGVIIEFGGWRMKVQLDEETLRGIASLTRGQYFAAPSGTQLDVVYRALKSRLVVEEEATEVTVFFANAAAILTLLSAGLSVWWFGRVQ
jgi:Ca-activated chloride channel family protein